MSAFQAQLKANYILKNTSNLIIYFIFSHKRLITILIFPLQNGQTLNENISIKPFFFFAKGNNFSVKTSFVNQKSSYVKYNYETVSFPVRSIWINIIFK